MVHYPVTSNEADPYIVGDLMSFRGPFLVKSNLEC